VEPGEECDCGSQVVSVWLVIVWSCLCVKALDELWFF
jgi:hypothetical protein